MNSTAPTEAMTDFVGAGAGAALGMVVVAGPYPFATRVVAVCLLTGCLAIIAFWTVRFWSFPRAGWATYAWLVSMYGIGVSSLVIGIGASVWGATGDAIHWLCSLLLVGEVGEHFGVRWVDGQNRWFMFGSRER